jgi:hypothetical protein
MEELIVFLESLKLSHYENEDCWYTCPKHPTETCCNTDVREKGVCICGADAYNEKLDKKIAELRLRSYDKDLLQKYNDFLLEHGYVDTDVYQEPPTAIDQFINLKK